MYCKQLTTEVQYGKRKKTRWEQKSERHMVREMHEVQLDDINRAKNLTLVFGINGTIYQLDKASGVRWYGHVLRIES